MDSPTGTTVENVAGRGVGMLAGLASLRGGGLLNYMMQRERVMNDPGFRAGLAGSPFASGFFGVGGGMTGQPGGMPPTAAVAQPEDFVGSPVPMAVAAPGYMPGTPRAWMPNLPPLAPEQALQEQARVSMMQGTQAGSALARGQAKLAAGIMPTQEEMGAVTGAANELVRTSGPGTTVSLDVPGMKVNIGSPYNLQPVSTDEYQTYGEAVAAAHARGSDWTVTQTNRGTWKPTQITPPITPAAPQPINPNAPTPPQQINPNAPATQPPRPPLAATAAPPLFAGAVATSGGPPPTLPTRSNNPGSIKDGPFAKSQPGYVGPGQAMGDGGHMAVFDSPASGFNAMGNLLDKPRYRGQTVGGAVSTWTAGGHDADFVRREIGLDPTRTMESLSPAEKATLVRGIAHGEGFQGPLGSGAAPGARPAAPVVAPAPAPRPAPRPAAAPAVAAAPPPRPAAPTGAPGLQLRQPQAPVVAPAPAPYMGAPYDPNAPAPGSQPYRVGYPSPAFGGEAPATAPPLAAVPEVAPTGEPAIPAPPVPAVKAPAQQAPVSVEPGTAAAAQVPLQRITVQGSGGTSYTYDYGAPSEFAEDMRRAGITSISTATPDQLQKLDQFQQARQQRTEASSADVQRVTRPASPGEAAGTGNLLTMRSKLDKFFEDFPNPADRDNYVGWISRPASEWLSYARDDPRFALFVHDLEPFQNFEAVKKSLTDYEQSDLGGTVPTGHERHATGFEQNLFDFDNALSENIGIRLALQRMPVGQQTAAWVNAQRAAFAKERAARRTDAAMAAMGLTPPEGGAPRAAAPEPATAPPATPPASAQGPIVFYGHTPGQP